MATKQRKDDQNLIHHCEFCNKRTKFTVPTGERKTKFFKENSGYYEEDWTSEPVRYSYAGKKFEGYSRTRLCVECNFQGGLKKFVEISEDDFGRLLCDAEYLAVIEKKLAEAEMKLVQVKALSKQLSGVVDVPEEKQSRTPSPQPSP